MPGGIISRSTELGAVAEFLSSATDTPRALVIEGDAGIGKTVLWMTAVADARAAGYRVLTARPGEAEAELAYTAIADLLGDVSADLVADLPALQREAIEQVLVQSSCGAVAPERRSVATAFLTVLERVSATAPVLIAVDNVHWLDPMSRTVLGFVVRRLKSGVGVLITDRVPGRGTPASALLRDTPLDLSLLRVGPLRLGALQTIVARHLGRSLPRPTMVRIAELSAGNPYYAMELARSIAAGSASAEPSLPATLAELMGSRIGLLEAESRALLLAAACAADPTAELLAQAIGIDVERCVDLIDVAIRRGLVAMDGNHVRFTHPLLARAVYDDAAPQDRRRCHRVLADVEALPEHRARHLALATVTADGSTLLALDTAADAARARHAPAAAAELVDLAIRLGGDTPLRRLRSASHHMLAGDNDRARALVEQIIPRLQAGRLRATAMNLLAEISMFHNGFSDAVAALEGALNDAADNPALAVRTCLLLSLAQLSSGDRAAALEAARRAVQLADQQDQAGVTSQALAMWVTVRCVCGYDIEMADLQRALDLEEPDDETPVPFRAHVVRALVSAWTGELADAHVRITEIRRGLAENGDEGHLLLVDLYAAQIDLWRSDFTAAAACATDALERAEHLGGDQLLVLARSVGALVAAHTGAADDANTLAWTAAEEARACGSSWLADAAAAALGFLKVSMGDYAAALDALRPLLERFDGRRSVEVNTGAHLPDAVEAMIALGRLDACEPFIDALERNGRRLDRPWLLAVGARCRAMLLGARGEVEAAESMARTALREHQRVSMPLDEARSLLLLGQLQRRRRQKDAATTTLREALDAFERMGARLWAERARAELARTNVCPSGELCLTPSEQRVADLAGAGMTNRDVAAALFISPKTVEANLARIYRKLGIHSRAELGQAVGTRAESRSPVVQVVS